MERLRCPTCKSEIELTNSHYSCRQPSCQARFPVVDGVPILINESNSIFEIDKIVQYRGQSLRSLYFGSLGKTKQVLKKILPSISQNIGGKRNYQKFTKLLLERTPVPQLLVLGGGTVAPGFADMLRRPPIEFVESDVYIGPRTRMVCDAHDIPFEDETFDGVTIQSVMGQVVDPYRCVDEIHRVLKPGGLVYADNPFMQQVCGAQYDFTRFTHLGNRRLFRWFNEIDSGVTWGPAMALAWSYQYFVLSLFRSAWAKAAAIVFVRTTAFWLKYLDYYLAKQPGALDAASGFYFLGEKSDRKISDKEVIAQYRGGQMPM